LRKHLFTYSAFGLSIASEFPLPELPEGAGEPDVVIRRGTVPLTSKKASGEEQFIFNTLTGGFRISNGREIVVDPLDNADLQAIRVVLLGRVMACLMAQRGWLPLHASGVLIGGKAALFSGPSGAGKSTLAAALHARGHTVITDDVAPVRVRDGLCEALPTWSRLRLSYPSMALMQGQKFEQVFQIDKYSLDLGRPVLPVCAPVGSIYILDFGRQFTVDTLEPLQAAAAISIHSLTRLHRCERDAVQVHVERCAAVARTCVVHQITRPKVFGGLPALAQYIENDMAAVHV
jgi:hypothetical protein